VGEGAVFVAGVGVVSVIAAGGFRGRVVLVIIRSCVSLFLFFLARLLAGPGNDEDTAAFAAFLACFSRHESCVISSPSASRQVTWFPFPLLLDVYSLQIGVLCCHADVTPQLAHTRLLCLLEARILLSDRTHCSFDFCL